MATQRSPAARSAPPERPGAPERRLRLLVALLAATTVLAYRQPARPIRLSAGDFARLAEAFFAELERRFR